MKGIGVFFGGLRRRATRWLWPLVIIGGIGWMFLQGRGENMSLTPPPIGGLMGSGSTPAPAAVEEPEAVDTSEVVEIDGVQLKTRGALILLNPTMVAPGSSVGVSGSGFDAGARVNITLKRSESDKGQQLDPVLADKGGSVSGVNVSIPDSWNGGSFTVIANQADGKHKSQATGQIQPSAPQVKLSDTVGKPGDILAMSVKGFMPDETVGIYLNSINTEPAATFKVDKSGNIGQGSLRVPFGAVGDQSLIFYGEKSQAPSVIPFTMLSLYPSATVDQYAIRADNVLTVGGDSFGPKEGIRVYLNGTDTVPLTVVQTNDEGSIASPARFRVPFALKGKQTVVLVGEKSQATATAGFEVMPYTPTVEPSTYGGRPGTVVTFYGTGFARNEVVHVRVGKTHDSPGKEVSCFMSDDTGAVNGDGGYTIPANAQGGTLVFAFIGGKSDGQASGSMEVTAAPPGSKAPPVEEAPFECPLEQPGGSDTLQVPANAPPPVTNQQKPNTNDQQRQQEQQKKQQEQQKPNNNDQQKQQEQQKLQQQQQQEQQKQQQQQQQQQQKPPANQPNNK